MEHLDLQLLRKEEIDKKNNKKRTDGPIFDYLQIILKKYRGAFLLYANARVHSKDYV